MGVLPEALLNFLGLMGWSMPDEREIFDIQEMIKALDLDRISTSGPVFDQTKLKWLNGQYLRKLDDSDYQLKFLRWLESLGGIERLLPLVKDRVETFSELAPITSHLIGNRAELSLADFNGLRVEIDLTKKILHHLLAALDAQIEWDKDSLLETCGILASSMDLKMRDFLSPVFVAISGKKVSLPLFDSMAILGPDLSRARLRDALSVIGVSGKEQKKLEKAFAALSD
jgi:glutamyl-tRNA synthetase